MESKRLRALTENCKDRTDETVVSLSWLRLVLLFALLWGLPREVRAMQVSIVTAHQNIVDGRIETTKSQLQEMTAQWPSERQAGMKTKPEADSLLQQGDEAFKISQYRTALESWQSALEIYYEIGDRRGESTLLGRLGSAYVEIGEYEQAINFLQQSLSIAQEIGDNQVEAYSLGRLGNVYRRIGEYEQAIDLLQQSLSIAREIGHRQGEAYSIRNLGVIYFIIGEHEQAIDFLQRSLSIAREIGYRQGEANALGNLGLAYERLDDYNQAIDFQQQSLLIAREIGDRQSELGALLNSGTVYFRISKYEQAIDFYQQSLRVAREIGYRQGEANALGSLGITYERLGEYEQAIDFHKHYLEIAREIGDRQGEAGSQGNLGLAYYSLGKYQQAIEFFQQALNLSREINDREYEVNSLGNLGNAYEGLGEYQQAIDSHQQASRIAQELGNRKVESNSLASLGVLYDRLGEHQRAMDFLQKSLAIKRKIGDRNGEAIVLGNLGNTWKNQNQSELAIVFYKSSINVYESIRADIIGLEQDLQSTYINSVQNPYRSLIDILLEQGRILEAQQVLELLKVDELKEFTRATYESDELQYDPIEQPVVDRYGTLINLGAKIYACHPNCEQALYDQQIILEQAFDEAVSTFEDAIRDNRVEDDIFYNPDGLASDALDIVNAQNGTVLIYPIVLEDTLWLLWTATGGVVGSIEVLDANQADLSRAVVQFRELLTKNDAQSLVELKQVGQQLYGWLIEPLSEELEKNNIQQLVFAQDRSTRYLPMSALYDGEQFLIENYTVSTVLSAALTDTTDRLGAVETANTLGLGLDQSFPGFNALPNVREELNAVVKTDDEDTSGIYPGSIFMNDDFTFATLSEQVRRHRILHIATHAEFVPTIKDASYILSGTGEQLTIDQIGALDTQFSNLHLVVLSACQTALGGESLDGTEIAGVSSYFLGKNKAEAVLATLWRVDDAGTSLLMQRFYEFMATGALTKAEALRQAQLSLLNGEATLDQRFETLGIERGGIVSEVESSSSTATLEHPYYWAPFILIGNSL